MVPPAVVLVSLENMSITIHISFSCFKTFQLLSDQSSMMDWSPGDKKQCLDMLETAK